MSTLKISGVSYSYSIGDGKTIRALKNISFDVEQGEYLALVGMNGSGKSTLAKLLNGLYIPSKGTVLVDGIDTANDDTIFEVRKKVGIVFQNPDNQAVATIVEDDVAFGPENLGIPRAEIVERVNEALEAVDMEKHRERTFSKLSGGQKQRVAIAGVLAMRPDVIILDEATSMLDPKGRRKIMSIVKKLNEAGITIINITHHMDEAAHANRIIVLKNGSIIADNTPKEIFASKVMDEAGLKLPLPAQIANQLNENGFNFESAPLTLNELMEEICQQLK
ncbi:MAG: energy-coupling factor transporter ATPase [Clostridia bacterium]|nr:energy-coupling factor transporter ATPase [Clostridia bacterium]